MLAVFGALEVEDGVACETVTPGVELDFTAGHICQDDSAD